MQTVFNDAESYELFLVLDTLARSMNGHNQYANYFRERLLPTYREWHEANPGRARPRMTVPDGEREKGTE